MSVIVTRMDMPKCCDVCERDCPEKSKIWYLADDKDINNGTAIHPQCPLKSIDGLIEKIQNVSDYEPLVQGGAYYGNRYKKADQLKDEIIDIIKEYCEVKE